jgi:hypothetical protein
MKESVLRNLLAGNLVKLVNGGLQGVYPFAFSARRLADGSVKSGGYAVQSPVVLSQLSISPGAQILSFFVMETDSMLRSAKQMFPKEPREEALKLAVSANAEVLNFVSSRISWLLAKLEGISSAEVSPPRVDNYSGLQAYKIRADEGAFFEFWAQEQALSFRFISCVQALTPAEAEVQS